MNSSKRVPVVCGIDAGSTNTKIVLMDESGLVVSRVVAPTPRDSDGLLIDAEVLRNTIESMIVQACGDGYVIHALCSAGVGEDGVLVDEHLRPVTPALPWFDPRRQGVYAHLHAALHDDSRLDVGVDQVRTVVGWAWATQQLSPAAARTWVALTDLAGVHLSGIPFLSETLASRTAAWSSTTRSWDSSQVRAALGSVEMLPPVMATGDVVGPLNAPAMREAGVAADTAIVVAGGHDHPIAGWAAGLLQPGAVLDSMGTAEVIVAHSPHGGRLRDTNIDVTAGIRSAGTTLLHVEELARNVQWACQDPDVARSIRQLLEGSVHPTDNLTDGFFIPGREGARPRYALTAPADVRARASAVLGALASSGRDAILAIQEELPHTQSVRLAGGWVRSPGWLHIKATVNGFYSTPILEPEVTAVGAALLSATAIGWRPDMTTAMGGFSSTLLR